MSSSGSKGEKHSDLSSGESDADDQLIRLTEYLKRASLSQDNETKTKKKIIENLTLEGLAKHWKTNGFKNVITVVGAGISTSAGIPDFRSPGTGLYHNLQKYNLPHPTAIFELDYFNENPKPFFVLAKELYPGEFKPTPCHYFVKLLEGKGILRRHYTQNIDTLERVAGISGEKLVEAHGTFYTNHCIRKKCRKEFSMEWMRDKIFKDEIPKCDKCQSLVKPDIVFFGEELPESFHKYPEIDFAVCDLLIIMGTSLEVQPFASLIGNAKPDCIRLLINRERVGRPSFWCGHREALKYECKDNVRDLAFIGDCDEGITKLVDLMGWGEELKQVMSEENKFLDKLD